MGTVKTDTETWITIDEGRTAAYAALTQDFNLLHLDADFAATTIMRRPIAHGTVSMIHAMAALRDRVGERALLDGCITVKFIRPVYVGGAIRIDIATASPNETTFQVVRDDQEIALVGTLAHPVTQT